MDNATSNDTQLEALGASDVTSISPENRVRCFAHTLNLSAKALLKPFTASLDEDESPPAPPPSDDDDDDDLPDLLTASESGSDDEDSEGDIDVLADLDEDERKILVANTEKIKKTLSKVCIFLFCLPFCAQIKFQIRGLSFAIIHSTTLALPAWKRACLTHSLPERLIPRDVRTRWNSTFDMLSFAVKYRKAIDAIAAERSLKLRKYELDEQEWKILGDLLMVLRVRAH
jgi:hypothetical protein